MPLPPVVIELSVADAASEHAARLVAACSQSVEDGDCALGGAEARRRDARAVAIVSWPDHSTGRIELGVRRKPGVAWTVRDLKFEPDDPESERWKSIGLVIGTLVGEAEAEAKEEEKGEKPAPAPAPPPPERAPAPAPIRERSRWGVWLGADAAAGPALDDGSWRFGAGLSAVLETTLRPLGIGGTVRYLVRPRDRNVTLDWLSFAAGISARPQLTPLLAGEIAISGVVERLHATAGSDGRTDSGSRWVSGARGRLGAMVLPSDAWALTLGGEVEWRVGATTIRVADQRVGDAPNFTYVLTLGAQLRLLDRLRSR